jgi:hypothetical protein
MLGLMNKELKMVWMEAAEPIFGIPQHLPGRPK